MYPCGCREELEKNQAVKSSPFPLNSNARDLFKLSGLVVIVPASSDVPAPVASVTPTGSAPRVVFLVVPGAMAARPAMHVLVAVVHVVVVGVSVPTVVLVGAGVVRLAGMVGVSRVLHGDAVTAAAAGSLAARVKFVLPVGSAAVYSLDDLLLVAVSLAAAAAVVVVVVVFVRGRSFLAVVLTDTVLVSLVPDALGIRSIESRLELRGIRFIEISLELRKDFQGLNVFIMRRLGHRKIRFAFLSALRMKRARGTSHSCIIVC